jgi:hypothetical protein
VHDALGMERGICQTEPRVWFRWVETSEWCSGHVGGPLAALSFRCTGHFSSVWGHFCSVKNKNGM